MKKVYATPTLVSGGDVVRETLGKGGPGEPNAVQGIGLGTIGFNL
jgi:hypothetical protein